MIGFVRNARSPTPGICNLVVLLSLQDQLRMRDRCPSLRHDVFCSHSELGRFLRNRSGFGSRTLHRSDALALDLRLPGDGDATVSFVVTL